MRWKEVEEEGERIVVGLVIRGLSGVSRKKCGVWGRGVRVRVLCGRRLVCVDGNQGGQRFPIYPTEQLRQLATGDCTGSERRVQ